MRDFERIHKRRSEIFDAFPGLYEAYEQEPIVHNYIETGIAQDVPVEDIIVKFVNALISTKNKNFDLAVSMQQMSTRPLMMVPMNTDETELKRFDPRADKGSI